MKKILITGQDSYIGMSFESHMEKVEGYEIDTLDMRTPEWKEKDFAPYDVVFHVAGIAHSDNGKISEERAVLYYEVNTKLAEEVAIKSKEEGVKQIIYMSSMSIYGDSAGIGQSKMINHMTEPKPTNAYGNSKLQAELKIMPLQSADFNVVVLRPPMIYGKDSKGNYSTLSKLARKSPVFPNIDNCRSMLYIENLCEFVHLMIANHESGVFMPQNSEYTRTSEMVKLVAQHNHKYILLTRVFNPFLRLLSPVLPMINKAFGNLSYEQSVSEYKDNYQIVNFRESIQRTEG
ncbi:MAG: NAD-dependent epimerase/dehydratase family protein [Eubacteriales bacterium]